MRARRFIDLSPQIDIQTLLSELKDPQEGETKVSRHRVGEATAHYEVTG
jgi:hypothetical protein